jgi:hypothetical protein
MNRGIPTTAVVTGILVVVGCLRGIEKDQSSRQA